MKMKFDITIPQRGVMLSAVRVTLKGARPDIKKAFKMIKAGIKAKQR